LCFIFSCEKVPLHAQNDLVQQKSNTKMSLANLKHIRASLRLPQSTIFPKQTYFTKPVVTWHQWETQSGTQAGMRCTAHLPAAASETIFKYCNSNDEQLANNATSSTQKDPRGEIYGCYCQGFASQHSWCSKLYVTMRCNSKVCLQQKNSHCTLHNQQVRGSKQDWHCLRWKHMFEKWQFYREILER
jgi:hypothetical protein